MHSAWLECETEQWVQTQNPTTASQHPRRSLICETEADDARAAAKIAEITGKPTYRIYSHRIYLSDIPLFEKLNEEAIALALKGIPCKVRGNAGMTESLNDGKTIYLAPIAGVYADDSLNVKYNLALWIKCKEEEEQRNQELLATAPLNKDTYNTIMGKLATSLKMQIAKQNRVEHLLLWMTLHDKIKGEPATDKIVKPLAISWARTHHDQRERYKKLIDESILTLIEERLRAIVKF